MELDADVVDVSIVDVGGVVDEAPSLVLVDEAGGTVGPVTGSAHVPTSGLVTASSLALGVKRGLDVVGSLVLLVVLAPVFLAITAAIAVTCGGPVFFVQRRVGRGGAMFPMLKFRTMCVDADERRLEIAHLNVHSSGPIFKVVDDPRVTTVGRFLRRTSLDELPQLVNVLLGHMSLVGPRPPIAEEVAQYDDVERGRLLAKPGMTCIWQVSGRSNVDFDRWVEMDLEYIRTWSLALDLKLLVLTIPAVVGRRGAY